MCQIKDKENKQLFIKRLNLIRYSKQKECDVTVLLLTSTPLAPFKKFFFFFKPDRSRLGAGKEEIIEKSRKKSGGFSDPPGPL